SDQKWAIEQQAVPPSNCPEGRSRRLRDRGRPMAGGVAFRSIMFEFLDADSLKPREPSTRARRAARGARRMRLVGSGMQGSDEKWAIEQQAVPPSDCPEGCRGAFPIAAGRRRVAWPWFGPVRISR